MLITKYKDINKSLIGKKVKLTSLVTSSGEPESLEGIVNKFVEGNCWKNVYIDNTPMMFHKDYAFKLKIICNKKIKLTIS